MLPNNRSDSDTGFASSATDSRTKLKAMMNGAAIDAGTSKRRRDRMQRQFGDKTAEALASDRIKNYQDEYRDRHAERDIDVRGRNDLQIRRYQRPEPTSGNQSTGIRSMRFMRKTQTKIVRASGAINRLLP